MLGTTTVLLVVKWKKVTVVDCARDLGNFFFWVEVISNTIEQEWGTFSQLDCFYILAPPSNSLIIEEKKSSHLFYVS